MDYIYKRKRVKIKCIKKHQKIKLALLAFFLIIIINIIVIIYCIYPVFESTCKIKARSVANKILNEEVSKVMAGYKYGDLVDIEKDDNGKITLASIKMVNINNVMFEIVNNIQKRIDEKNIEEVYINLGKASGISMFSYMGPRIKIELERNGNVKANVNSEFEDVGINQTLHKINILLNCSINIITPVKVIGDIVENKLLLTETVIVGEVPTGYYNVEYIEEDIKPNSQKK